MKKYIIILFGIIIVAVGVYILKDKFMKNDNMKIELINPIDKRVLTKQGKDILVKAIQDKDYSTKVINTSYEEWEPLIEKGIRLNVYNEDINNLYIIPSGLSRWMEGQAFVTYPDPNDAKSENTSRPVKFIYDKIQFNNFKPSDFLNEDSNFVKEVSTIKRKVSYALQYSGSDVVFQLSINNKQVIDSKNIKNDNSYWGGNDFSLSIPINKYLTYGDNTIKITSIKKLSDSASLHAVLLDMNKQSDIFKEGDINLIEGYANVLDVNIPKDYELEEQASIFD